MGILKHVSSQRSVVLSVHTVAGRAPGCAVQLANHAASNDHASVFWTGERWEARDLGSTNGTFVDGRRLEPKENAHLTRGTVLRFGSEEERWELMDDRGPVAVARSVATGEIRLAENGLLALPDPNDVRASVIMDSVGQWFIETQDGLRRAAKDKDQITIAGQTWELLVPPASPVGGTYKAKTGIRLATLALRFLVTRDDKHIRIEARDGEHVQLLEERASFFLLLRLARARLKDAADAKLPDDEQGWLHVIDAAAALHKEESHLNVDVLRAREVFAKAGVEGAEGIVQRRPREIRIGTGRLDETKA